ncbi:MAG: hypothetical protein GY769_23610 [bacterium]|nr:hypothetical protein [bacterium]
MSLGDDSRNGTGPPWCGTRSYERRLWYHSGKGNLYGELAWVKAAFAGALMRSPASADTFQLTLEFLKCPATIRLEDVENYINQHYPPDQDSAGDPGDDSASRSGGDRGVGRGHASDDLGKASDEPGDSDEGDLPRA